MMKLPSPKWRKSRKRYCYQILPLCMASCPTDILPPVQIAESSELVGEVEDFTSLEREYAEDDLIYQAKIKVSLDIA